MIISDERLRSHANNLTMVRLLLASAVIWSHSYWRMTGVQGRDEISSWAGAPISSFAVDGFFFLSGFLVYASLLRRGSVVDFLRARFLRLWPALAVSVAMTVLIGGAVTRIPLPAYLQNETAHFLLGNLSLVHGSYKLSGVYCGDALCTVNGSLWTIPWEARCYAVLALLCLVKLASRSAMTRMVLPCTLAGLILWRIPGVETGISHAFGNAISYHLGMMDRLWGMFALGIAAFIFRQRISLSWTACGALLALMLLEEQFGLSLRLDSLFTGYAVLCLGFLTARNKAISAKWPDYSYGIYIYAFPVMMLLAGVIPFPSHAWLALATLLATLPLAVVSWHFLEKPMLDWGRGLGARRIKAAPPAVA